MDLSWRSVQISSTDQFPLEIHRSSNSRSPLSTAYPNCQNMLRLISGICWSIEIEAPEQRQLPAQALPDLLYSCRDWFPLEISWIWIRNWLELSSVTPRSSPQLPRLVSFRNQLNFSKNLNGNELRHFQISSTAAETDFLQKSTELQ